MRGRAAWREARRQGVAQGRLYVLSRLCLFLRAIALALRGPRLQLKEVLHRKLQDSWSACRSGSGAAAAVTIGVVI